MKYKIEFLPRYGTTIGVIWKHDEDDDTTEVIKNSIGHIRMETEKEKELWKKAVTQMNLDLQKETS